MNGMILILSFRIVLGSTDTTRVSVSSLMISPRTHVLVLEGPMGVSEHEQGTAGKGQATYKLPVFWLRPKRPSGPHLRLTDDTSRSARLVPKCAIFQFIMKGCHHGLVGEGVANI